MLAAQTSAMPSRTHLKSEWIKKLTAAISPIESAPAPPGAEPSHGVTVAERRSGQGERQH
ncbi:hypothetical protein LUI11_33380 [Bradyrhizobium diazoefficiens]|nr:hypothetical protein [Bradyrhizobium diazoefficiens]APO56870.1 hypothetical protein BD122_41295 [Bradyrhizobium diazoefficiens]MCD9296391.1 hypothetical protein [Bradyrhizobium diazoefficiens]MCD9814915.1 hypothetical protein [Bradyrhizobium diazoefficiens]MCD9833040.1 hypothetical protein [Bradyrhizobium diazoefficiens]MCD9851721.1 hypothetical protein [Bradyrhizobium diazoefficiens]